MPAHIDPATRNTRDHTRDYKRRWWSDLVRRYQPGCFAVIPAGESRADKVRHLFSCAGLSHGNCRWYAFETGRSFFYTERLTGA